MRPQAETRGVSGQHRRLDRTELGPAGNLLPVVRHQQRHRTDEKRPAEDGKDGDRPREPRRRRRIPSEARLGLLGREEPVTDPARSFVTEAMRKARGHTRLRRYSSAGWTFLRRHFGILSRRDRSHPPLLPPAHGRRAGRPRDRRRAHRRRRAGERAGARDDRRRGTGRHTRPRRGAHPSRQGPADRPRVGLGRDGRGSDPPHGPRKARLHGGRHRRAGTARAGPRRRRRHDGDAGARGGRPDRRARRHGSDAAAQARVRARRRPPALRLRSGGHPAIARHRGAAASGPRNGRGPRRRLPLQRHRRAPPHRDRLRARGRVRGRRGLPRRFRR